MLELLIALLMSVFGTADTGQISESQLTSVAEQYDIPVGVVEQLQSRPGTGNGQITFDPTSIDGDGNGGGNPEGGNQQR